MIPGLFLFRLCSRIFTCLDSEGSGKVASILAFSIHLYPLSPTRIALGPLCPTEPILRGRLMKEVTCSGQPPSAARW